MELSSHKNHRKLVGFLMALVLVVGLGSVSAFAQGSGAVSSTVDSGPFAEWTLASFFGFILNLILAVGFSLTLIMLAMGFIQYIMAQGDKLGVEKAQKWVTYSVIGGLGLFLVFAIRSAIQKAAGGALNVGEGVTI
jgi:Na+-driven multidrug efflux pump